MRLEARRDALEEVRETVRERIAAIDGDQRDALTRDLLAAAAEEFDEGDDVRVHGRSDDEALIEEILDDYDGYEYAGEYDCLGGVVVESEASRVRVNNTFDSVLEDVWGEQPQGDQHQTVRRGPMSASGTANYEYVVARVRHRRASLFSDDDYRKLLRMGTSEIARFMEESVYEDAVNALGSRHSGVDLIEYALNETLAQTFDDLLRWSEGRLYEQVARYLRKFDAWNVKTVIRGRYSDATNDEIRTDLIDAGEFDETFLDRLVAAENIEAVVDLLEGTMFGPYVEPAFGDYEATGTLVPWRTPWTVRTTRISSPDGGDSDSPQALYAEFLQAEIDFRNARNAPTRPLGRRRRPRRVLHRGRDAVLALGDESARGQPLGARHSHPREPLRRRTLGSTGRPGDRREPHRLRARPRPGAAGVLRPPLVRLPAVGLSGARIRTREGT